MKFHKMLLSIDDDFPIYNDFVFLMNNGLKRYRRKNYLYLIEQFFEGQFYWMYFQYENENLYVDTVFDTSDDMEKSNPRPKNQVELKGQFFACYDLHKNVLYISDYTKKSVLSAYIAEMIGKTVEIKNIYEDLDKFIEAVRDIKRVVFTQRKNLFTMEEDTLFKTQASILGLDLPERSKLQLDYGSTPIGKIKTSLQNWKSERERGRFEEIVVVGTDDRGIEHSFNYATMLSALEFDVAKDENLRYNENVVRVNLIAKLEALDGKTR